MATRSAKRSVNAEGQQLTHIESLLIAQAAWEMGTSPSIWPAIAKVLSKHPLVTRPKSFFTAQTCHALYDSLLQDAGLESNEENSSVQSVTNLALAKKYFQLRYDELRELILAEENAFRTILNEIEEIKAGKWDSGIKAKVAGRAEESSRPEAEPSTALAETGGEETFSGSDLSGVTETSSPSLHRDEETEMPTPSGKGRDDVSSSTELQEGSPQSTAEPLVEETLTPIKPGLTETNDFEIEMEEGTGGEETPAGNFQLAEEFTGSKLADASAQRGNDKDTEQLRQEEEEEEEDVVTGKPEEEETDHEDQTEEPETIVEQVTVEDFAQLTEHKPEEEEEEEETKETPQEHQEMETEEPAPQEDESQMVRAPSENRESQGREEDMTQQAEGGVASDDEQTQELRRSTRHRRPSISLAPVAPTRKSRRQRRVSEPDAQSPAITEGEHPDVDETKAETPQVDEDQPSSPAPVDPIGPRRRKRKASIVEAVESPRDRKRQRDESEPAEDEDHGPSATGQRGRRRGDRSEEQVALKRFQNVIGMLHSQISQHRNGNIFHNPIRTVEAPDYHDIVKRPMDLKTIKARVKDGLIANSLEYQRDIFLMFANAMMYNRPGSDVYHMAEDMMHESEGYIMTFRQTEGLVRGRP